MPNVTIPNPNTPIDDDSWYVFLYSFSQYARCNLNLRIGGILENSTEEASNSGSSATDLINYIFQKNQLKSKNDCLLFSYKGIYAANVNTKQLVLTFGSQTIFDTTALAINSGAWIFEVEVVKTGSSTQNIFVKAFYNNLAKTAFVAGTQDLSDNIEAKLTATGVSSGDITIKGYCFNLNPID